MPAGEELPQNMLKVTDCLCYDAQHAGGRTNGLYSELKVTNRWSGKDVALHRNQV